MGLEEGTGDIRAVRTTEVILNTVVFPRGKYQTIVFRNSTITPDRGNPPILVQLFR